MAAVQGADPLPRLPHGYGYGAPDLPMCVSGTRSQALKNADVGLSMACSRCNNLRR
jgi:hypothetical protein